MRARTHPKKERKRIDEGTTTGRRRSNERVSDARSRISSFPPFRAAQLVVCVFLKRKIDRRKFFFIVVVGNNEDNAVEGRVESVAETGRRWVQEASSSNGREGGDGGGVVDMWAAHSRV